MSGAPPKYRFAIEPLDNGWLVKISEPGSDKLVGRWSFRNVGDMLDWLANKLSPPE